MIVFPPCINLHCFSGLKTSMVLEVRIDVTFEEENRADDREGHEGGFYGARDSLFLTLGGGHMDSHIVIIY